MHEKKNFIKKIHKSIREGNVVDSVNIDTPLDNFEIL